MTQPSPTPHGAGPASAGRPAAARPDPRIGAIVLLAGAALVFTLFERVPFIPPISSPSKPPKPTLAKPPTNLPPPETRAENESES